MWIKDLGEMLFSDSRQDIQEHIKTNSNIRNIIGETLITPVINFSNKSKHIPSVDGGGTMDLMISRVALNMGKIMMMKAIEIDEREVYRCEGIMDAVDRVSEFMDELGWRGVWSLRNHIDSRSLKELNRRLSKGYIDSMFREEDGIMERAMWIFKAMNFSNRKELDGFGHDVISMKPEIKEQIEILSKRIFNKFMEVYEYGDEVDFFPIYGRGKDLTSRADIRIGNKIFIVSCLDKEYVTREVALDWAVIMKTCEWLSQKSMCKMYIYHGRWDSTSVVC